MILCYNSDHCLHLQNSVVISCKNHEMCKGSINFVPFHIFVKFTFQIPLLISLICIVKIRVYLCKQHTRTASNIIEWPVEDSYSTRQVWHPGETSDCLTCRDVIN